MFLEEIYCSEPRFFVVMLTSFLVFCVAGRLRERRRRPTVPKRRKTTALVDDVPHALPIFDYCYFYWDFRREPLRRREPLT